MTGLRDAMMIAWKGQMRIDWPFNDAVEWIDVTKPMQLFARSQTSMLCKISVLSYAFYLTINHLFIFFYMIRHDTG